ncbi:MAG: SDR family oxidoreductase [Candidatus Polarisedimenticolaceae bacterium]|nr:SDR family oxidoreductase [Candidatus Polarisedimenticolaceae bacterium]
MRVLVLGASGMLGSAVFRLLMARGYEVTGTVRSSSSVNYFSSSIQNNLISNLDLLNANTLICLFQQVKPHAVINCIGLIKQFSSSNDPQEALPINALLPHQLADLCDIAGVRLVQISTDCVFKGDKGNYTEDDLSDATDLYGQSKYMGEVRDRECAVTLRTSIIGHGLTPNPSLIDWFLSQNGQVRGFNKAIFSGLPTIELANVIDRYVLQCSELSGLYHVSVEPIDKLRLLQIVNQVYDAGLVINQDDSLVIDRSLNSTKFRESTGYTPPDWEALVLQMHKDQLNFKEQR